MCALLYVCVGICTCAPYSMCVWVSAHVRPTLCVCEYLYMCALLYVCVSICTCAPYSMCVWVSVHVRPTLCVCGYLYMCALLYVCVGICTCAPYSMCVWVSAHVHPTLQYVCGGVSVQAPILNKASAPPLGLCLSKAFLDTLLIQFQEWETPRIAACI